MVEESNSTQKLSSLDPDKDLNIMAKLTLRDLQITHITSGHATSKKEELQRVKREYK